MYVCMYVTIGIKVFENDTTHFTGTTESEKRNAEKVSLQSTA